MCATTSPMMAPGHPAVRALELENLGTDENEDALPEGQVMRIG